MRGEKVILVVEDDDGTRELVAWTLEAEGFRVETASHGREALTTAERIMPDLILLDLRMPVMSGWEFAREFRARYGEQVPIVVLTASGRPEQHAAEIDAAAAIGKPFDLDALVQVVRSHTSEGM